MLTRSLQHALWFAMLLVLASGARASDFGQGLLWRIEPPNGAAASHLFGTIHLDDVRVVRRVDAVRGTLEDAQRFAMEMVTDADSAAIFAAAATLPAGQHLGDLVGADYPALEALLRNRYGIPPYQTERMAPWLAYVTLNLPGPRTGYILDELLHILAQRRGLPVSGLEPVEAQIAAMTALSPAQQTALLLAALREHDAVLAGVETLVQLYLAEDLDAMAGLQDASLERHPQLAEAHTALLEHVLYRRNPGMAQRAAALADAGGAFMAVGALHLHGPRGLLALLQQAGYGISRVPLRTD